MIFIYVMSIENIMDKIFIFLSFVLSQNCISYGDNAFDFNINANDGTYALSINGKLWLESGPTFFNGAGQVWSTDSKERPLVLTKVNVISGGDITEQWKETQFMYSLGNTTMSVMAGIRLYTGSVYSSRVLFTQHFLTGASATSKGLTASNETISGFPCFKVKDPDEDLGFLSYGGYMFGNTAERLSKFSNSTDNINDGISGGPLALFNMAGNTVVISPYNHFMTASLWHDRKPGGHVSWGIMGGVNEIPANFSYHTLLMFDNGINKAFEAWGFELRKQYGIFNAIDREKNIRKDISLNYLGYWTDNGAYYYYNPESNKTFEQTILDVKKYSDLTGIPYGYLQIDSWWYPKDNNSRAVLTWTAMKDVFPHGIKYLHETTNWPIVAHNRYWSKHTPYAKQNGGNFSFVVENYISLPDDQLFWSSLLADAKEWGLIVYEQDWLNVQTQYLEELQTNLTLGRHWLLQMATAAEQNNQTIQYCMANPRHALQSMEFPVVTQARVTDDYLYEQHNHREPQWKVGVSSIFARAMRLQPYKDTFWTTSVQPGNTYNKTEPYPALEAVVSSLSAGPVGPSDMINGTDVKLLMKCCRADGKLLKPSRPATAIDRQMITDAFRPKGAPKMGDVWTTQSFISTNGVMREYGILFAADVQTQFSVGIADLGFNVLSRGIFYPYNNISHWKRFDSSTVIDLSGCSKQDFCLFFFSPYLTGPVEAILGEHKWIPMSAARIGSLSISTGGRVVGLTLNKSPKSELVTFAYILNGHLYGKDCWQFRGFSSTCKIYEDDSVDSIVG